MPVLAIFINSELSLGKNFKASFLSFFLTKHSFFYSFSKSIFLDLLTTVCLEIRLIVLIADFVFAIIANI